MVLHNFCNIILQLVYAAAPCAELIPYVCVLVDCVYLVSMPTLRRDLTV